MLVNSMKFEDLYTPEPNCGCWLWSGPSKGGKNGNHYGSFGTEYAHRASYKMHKGEIPKGYFVCHSCDVPKCVNPHHLFLGTLEDNNADMRAKGRGVNPPRNCGERHHNVKLTAVEVIEIRRSTLSAGQAAEMHGVSPATIKDIRRRRTWQEI